MQTIIAWWNSGTPSARAARTAWQAFVSTFMAVLVAVLTGYANTHNFDWQALYYEGVVLGVAAALGYLMNIPKPWEGSEYEGCD